MHTNKAVKHYGSVFSLAKALNITTQAVYKWGNIVPRESALELERMTGGVLEAGPKPQKRGRK
jgi:hypothetical protein